jgi:hypothetical protein
MGLPQVTEGIESDHGARGIEPLLASFEVFYPLELDSLGLGVPGGVRALGLACAYLRNTADIIIHWTWLLNLLLFSDGESSHDGLPHDGSLILVTT